MLRSAERATPIAPTPEWHRAGQQVALRHTLKNDNVRRISPPFAMKTQISSFELAAKGELIALCDRLLTEDSDAVEECIAFIEAETMGVWHGRARAMMARRLKHCRLSQPQRTSAVRAILDRLVSGRFSEQFKDQLRFVLHVSPERAFAVARSCQGAATEHVRRYATWILSHETHDRRA
jgi:uncharacterized protein YgbK (DUF1537 family)